MMKKKQPIGKLILGVTLITVALATWFFSRSSTPSKVLAIVPARWTFVDPAGLDSADETVCEAVTAQVARRGKVPVIGWPSILPFRTNPKQGPELAKATGATLVLAISVRQTGVQSRVTVFLVEPFTGRKRWAEDFYAQDLKTPDALRSLAETIAHDLELALGTAN